MADDHILTTDNPEVARIWVAYRLTMSVSNFFRLEGVEDGVIKVGGAFEKFYKAVEKATTA